MSLVIPMAFLIAFLLVAWALDTVNSLLLYSAFILYITIYFTTFFTDTMTLDLSSKLQLITGSIAALCFAKAAFIANKKRIKRTDMA